MKLKKSLAAMACVMVGAWFAGPAFANALPPIRTSDANEVPKCVTPGRLMSFIKGRNKRFDTAFDGIATEYQRHGEKLGVRWDYAFFQMMVETGNLAFTGDVRSKQNNFAGLGATGGVPGESFKDVSTGVRAHLEHVLLYSGAQIENPVADRTRKLQEWKVLASWYKNIKGPLTYSDLAKRWAPGSNSYPRDIASVGSAFFKSACAAADPNPDLVASNNATTPEKQVAALEPEKPATADAATAAASDTPPATQPPAPSKEPPVETKILNQQAPPVAAAESSPPEYQTAAAGTAASQAEPPKEPDAAASAASRACRVWTASYGGQKAIIIKATADKTVNYTVLDVNEGKEKREAEAYIAAYAKGGETVGEFATQTLALDKAFELCPEG